MKCPNCNLEMKLINTKSHYDISIILDQCPHCGGLWFERDELYLVKLGEAKNIENIDEDLIKKDVTIKEELYCPKDKSKLEVFKDLNFPSSIKVEACRRCGGFWFNKGEFIDYQTHREKLMPKKEESNDQKLKKSIENLLNSSSNDYNTLGNLGKFLSKPINSPLGINISNNSNIDANQLYGTIYSIIRVLMKIFLKI